MGAVSFRSWTLWNVERSTAGNGETSAKGKIWTLQPASVAGPMLGAVGAAAERGRSGTENPCEDARASGAAGFLHDVLDVLFDRSAALTSAHSSLTAIGSTSAAAFPFSACVIFLLSSRARRFMCISFSAG